MLVSPLEQFEIIPLIRIVLFGIDFSLTNSGFFCILAIISIMYVADRVFVDDLRVIPTQVQVFYEMLYMFLADMIKTQVGPKGIHYLPIFSCTFLLILTLNVLGLMPFGFTVTSHIVILSS
jgi:F-type H+-transporting ATPase subunit a